MLGMAGRVFSLTLALASVGRLSVARWSAPHPDLLPGGEKGVVPPGEGARGAFGASHSG